MLLRHLFVILAIGPWLVFAGDRPRLVVVTEAWPPYVIDDAERPGFDVETSRRVLDAMGYRMELKLMPWRRAQIQVEAGTADALLEMFASEERRRELHFPEEPLSYSTSSLFCYQCTESRTPSYDELDQTAIAVNRGYHYGEAFNRHPGIRRVEVSNFDQGFRLLVRGRVEYYAINNRVGFYTLRQMGLDKGFRALSPPLVPGEPAYLVFAPQPGYDELAAEFSRRLVDFKRTDAYRAILERYNVQPE